MSRNTLYIRLAGPMQSWGTSSRLQLRRTDHCPSKSGVLGLLLCAKGTARSESARELRILASLTMGVRIDRAGQPAWDYHTTGGGHGYGRGRAIGIRSAEGLTKRTESTGKPETLLSRRQYLFDASFLVALQGEPAIIDQCAAWLKDPVWPIFLGRKCCVPGEPVLENVGNADSLRVALESQEVPWRPRIAEVDNPGRVKSRRLECCLEHPAGEPLPEGAQIIHDVPRVFGVHSHDPRLVIRDTVEVPVGEPLHPRPERREWVDPYGPQWEALKNDRLQYDHGLCVFCKAPATEVHHLDYGDVCRETLRSLCGLCHEACTSMEYGHDMQHCRIDPCDESKRSDMLTQIDRLLQHRRFSRRRELLAAGRISAMRIDKNDAPVRDGDE